MSPPKQQLPDPATLLQLSNLISTTTTSLIAAQSTSLIAAQSNSSSSSPNSTPIPSTEIYNLQQTLISATAMLSSLISDPRVRLIEIGAQFLEACALHIVAEKRIPNILAKEGEKGARIEELSEKVGIEALKLGIPTSNYSPAMEHWEHFADIHVCIHCRKDHASTLFRPRLRRSSS